MSLSNSVRLIGRLTKEIEVRKTQNGKSVCSYSVAVSNGKKADGSENTVFINCVAWDKAADNLSMFAHKGNMLAIDGELSSRQYTTREGSKVTVTEVITREWRNLSPKGSNPAPASVSDESQFDDMYSSYANESDF